MVVPFKLDNRTTGSEGLKPIGPGLGVRASYLLKPGFVISSHIMNYFGELNSESRGMTTIMVELGWAFALGPVAIEPFVGIGPTLQRRTVGLCNAITSECYAIDQSETMIGASIGVGMSTPLNDRWFLGGTATMLGSVGPMLSVSAFATTGLRL
jgi:hypothetical protein